MVKFYPLQLEIHLKEEAIEMGLTKDNITFATPADVDDWMELVSLTVDGYPRLHMAEYRESLHPYIADKRALILRDGGMAMMLFMGLYTIVDTIFAARFVGTNALSS